MANSIHSEHIISYLILLPFFYGHSNITDSTFCSLKGFNIISINANCEIGVISKYNLKKEYNNNNNNYVLILFNN